MFDYAMFHQLLNQRLSDKSENILYVCTNANVKKGFIKRHPDIPREYVLTINEIWSSNKIVKLRYKDYVII